MQRILFITLFFNLFTGILPLHAVEYLDWVEWDKICHWAGDPNGTKKCALVIDFQDGQSNQAYVWGYRWNGTATGEDLVRAVASQSSILTAMIQYTGTMGSTLNALGISRNREELNYLEYDFNRAAIAGEVSFGYFDANKTMGQETAPGYEAENMCKNAILDAIESGIIEHPLNAFVYGYPAYDYDYWQLHPDYAKSYEFRWKSGWYDGYWSYWHGPNDYDFLSYSGLGMSSTVLLDGGVQAWKYTPLNGGDSFGATGGEMAYELNYDMSDWEENMHELKPVELTINQDNIKFWVGEGEKSASVVLQFNDSKGPENLVYGYRWSGGWDDSLSEVIEEIAKADSRIKLNKNDNQTDISYDSDDNGLIDKIDHNGSEGVWHYYVKRTIDKDFNKVPAKRWLNPNAVLILSCQEKDVSTVELPYTFMRPASGSERILSIPDEIEYTLADEDLSIPMFVQLPEGGKINTAFTWSRPEMLSRINTHEFKGIVSSYKNFIPCESEVSVRGSYVPQGSTSAVGLESNKCRIVFKAPLMPVETFKFENEIVSIEKKEKYTNELIIFPEDATYTKFTFRSSNPEIVSVNAATGEITAMSEDGSATITATYNFDPSVCGSYAVNVGNNVSVTSIEETRPQIIANGDEIIIINAEGEEFVIFTLQGGMIDKFRSDDKVFRLHLNLPHGIYLISEPCGSYKKICL